VTNEVFLTVFKELHVFQKRDGNIPSFRPWLRRIAGFKVLSYHKRNQRRPLPMSNSDLERRAPYVDDRPGDSDSDSDLDQRDELALVVRCAFEEIASEFEPATVQAVRRVVLDAEPVEAVARALGKSTNAINISTCRVLKRLRSFLLELGEPLELALAASTPHAEPNHGDNPT
jgi:DNA-directed RNA polymerase specialized sigma24 family protein